MHNGMHYRIHNTAESSYLVHYYVKKLEVQTIVIILAISQENGNQVKINKSVLTTVQQRGQNHQRRARASSRKRISRAMKRMVPVSCKKKVIASEFSL